MLKNTFVHIPGIGDLTERRLWDEGIISWDDFLDNEDSVPLQGRTKQFVRSYVKESKKHLDNKNHHYFVDKIPRKELWRAYKEFKDSVAFLDIETTGLSSERHVITMIGVYDGEESKVFTRGRNLSKFPSEINKFKSIVTFNGARFDIPFIQSAFPGLRLHQIHIDMRDNLIVCTFALGTFDEDLRRQAYKAVTGRQFTALMETEIGNRVWTLTRLYNLREGIGREDDHPSYRHRFDPLPSGVAEGCTSFESEKDMEACLDAYYRFRGWDMDGVPTSETVASLGLDWF